MTKKYAVDYKVRKVLVLVDIYEAKQIIDVLNLVMAEKCEQPQKIIICNFAIQPVGICKKQFSATIKHLILSKFNYSCSVNVFQSTVERECLDSISGGFIKQVLTELSHLAKMCTGNLTMDANHPLVKQRILGIRQYQSTSDFCIKNFPNMAEIKVVDEQLDKVCLSLFKYQIIYVLSALSQVDNNWLALVSGQLLRLHDKLFYAKNRESLSSSIDDIKVIDIKNVVLLTADKGLKSVAGNNFQDTKFIEHDGVSEQPVVQFDCNAKIHNKSYKYNVLINGKTFLLPLKHAVYLYTWMCIEEPVDIQINKHLGWAKTENLASLLSGENVKFSSESEIVEFFNDPEFIGKCEIVFGRDNQGGYLHGMSENVDKSKFKKFLVDELKLSTVLASHFIPKIVSTVSGINRKPKGLYDLSVPSENLTIINFIEL